MLISHNLNKNLQCYPKKTKTNKQSCNAIL